MKRKYIVFLAVLLVTLLVGCANNDSADSPEDMTDTDSAPTIMEDESEETEDDADEVEIEYDSDEAETEDYVDEAETEGDENVAVSEDDANEAAATEDDKNDIVASEDGKNAAAVPENNSNKPATEDDVKEAENNENEAVPEVVAIKVTSESLTSYGKWLTVIKSTRGNPPGANLSPQLSWDKVEGASCYAIYMVDNSAGNWLHWLAKNVTENNLPLGAELKDSKYEGPYPPSGIHEYEVIVYALKAAPDKYPGKFDNINSSVSAIEEKLDIANGKSGNIIGKGSVIGTVTFGETVE